MKPTTIYRHHENLQLQLPDHLADWDVWDYWERERYRSIVECMTNREGTLWEIGAEHGAQAALYAQALGGERLVLVEPSHEFWPNIRMTWEANGFADPQACVIALVSSTPSPDDDVPRLGVVSPRGVWPTEAMGDVECPAMPYKYLHQGDGEAVHVTTLDEMLADPNIVSTGLTTSPTAPGGISIDVEGAELLVLEGARQVITQCRPLIWVSIHQDLLARDYDATPADIIDLMGTEHGYRARLLATDHEEHWLFVP